MYGFKPIEGSEELAIGQEVLVLEGVDGWSRERFFSLKLIF
jgi:hypothetical protein